MTSDIISRIPNTTNKYVANIIMFAGFYYSYRFISTGPISPVLYVIIPAIKNNYIRKPTRGEQTTSMQK